MLFKCLYLTMCYLEFFAVVFQFWETFVKVSLKDAQTKKMQGASLGHTEDFWIESIVYCCCYLSCTGTALSI